MFAPAGNDSGSIDEASRSETIPETAEPPSGPSSAGRTDYDSPSVLAQLLRNSPPELEPQHDPEPSEAGSEPESDLEHVASRDSRLSHPESTWPTHEGQGNLPSEHTPLLRRTTSSGTYEYDVDVENQKGQPVKKWLRGLAEGGHKVEGQVSRAFAVAFNPRRWDRKAIWQNAIVTPASCLPAVAVGLLLNILDALSYGKSTLCTGIFSANLAQA